MSTLLDKTTVIRDTGYRYWLAPLKMTTSGVKLPMKISPTPPVGWGCSESVDEPCHSGSENLSTDSEHYPPVRLTQQAVNELRKSSGLTWEQLACLFDVSRRSVHFWASGQPLASAHEEKLNRILDAVQYISLGSASLNRSLLMSVSKDGRSYLELLAAGEYEAIKRLLGVGNAHTKPQLAPLAPAADRTLVPPNPADLVDALQDPIHREVGKSKSAKSVRSRKPSDD
jgi:DNA-binding transcriptional regulator YiaG